MGLWTKLKGELIDIVEWLDPTSNTLVHRFERYNNEIKYSSKLVVRASQACVFVNMGKIADVFEPGMYSLDTKNLPILSTLMGWKYGFNSPFKCEVYFVCTRKFTDNKWGTKNPIMLRDPEFGPVRLRAFGTYAFQVADPAKLITQIAGTDARFSTDEISEQLRNLIVARFADLLGESKLPILDLAANALTDAAKNPGTAGDSMGLGMGLLMAGQMGQMMPQQGAAPAAGGPPPLPSAPKYYVALGGQQAGPFEVPLIQQQVMSKQVTPDTLVWKTGMAAWKKASEVPELAGLFNSVPPPLPT